MEFTFTNESKNFRRGQIKGIKGIYNFTHRNNMIGKVYCEDLNLWIPSDKVEWLY